MDVANRAATDATPGGPPTEVSRPAMRMTSRIPPGPPERYPEKSRRFPYRASHQGELSIMGKTIPEIEAALVEAETKRDRADEEVNRIAAKPNLTDGDVERSAAMANARGKAITEIDELSRALRIAMRDEVRRVAEGGGGVENGDGAATLTRTETRWSRPRRDSNEQAVISRALRTVDAAQRDLSSASGDRVNELLRREPSEDYDPSYIARRINITETREYKTGFMQALSAGQRGMPAILSAGETNALREYQELERMYNRAFDNFNTVERAMSENGANSAGLGVPAFIDPSIILTSGAADVPLLRVCRIADVTTNLWKGVSSQGMVWSYDTEAAEVSDDAPALAQPSATVHMARGFIPYSIEAGMDYPDFAVEMSRLIDQGYNDLLAAKLMTGSGSGEPYGIFTACDASTFTEVAVTTDGQFGGPDVFKIWNSLPERFRSRATWVMSVHVQSAIRQFAAAATTGSAYFTIDLTGGQFKINERPVIMTDYAPTFSGGSVPGTTGAQNILTIGDWQNAYVFARRAGMSIEPVPHLFSTSNGRPTGSRGLFAWARNGANLVNVQAARLLQNT